MSYKYICVRILVNNNKLVSKNICLNKNIIYVIDHLMDKICSDVQRKGSYKICVNDGFIYLQTFSVVISVRKSDYDGKCNCARNRKVFAQ